ncbi:NIPSNAP family protein [Arenibacter sp. GZD96]|uniref:NIPSNAP family protein n=1 Tax=Aurantibrevibacter litoralis TaxID=3106030 RepID=UPI002AFDE879|nr:NIPSNAP family protein [Arenibacter sp. GZD-96]MEA1786049.1 NIPSNAP family protein [Arenibacter sp. GZD-96]
MKKPLMSAIAVFTVIAGIAQQEDTRYYELRTYHTNEGKRPELIQRFQNHTLALFEESGMENIAYFLPLDSENQTLVYFLAYPDKASREVMWKKFLENPKWKAAYQKSIENGKLVAKIDEVYLRIAPELNHELPAQQAKDDTVFELRTYYCLPDKLDDLHARFRDHTLKLFEKHGMANIVYWLTDEKDGAQSKLVYLLAHQSMDAAKASWENFRTDPEWIRARDASEVDGKIVEKVESLYLKALPFSAIK